MPPITSSRPGARLMRTGVPGIKSAVNSAQTRASSVGTGSRDNKCFPADASICCGDGTGGGRFTVCGCLRFYDDTRKKSSAIGCLECRGQDVVLVPGDLIVSQAKHVRSAGGFP